MINTITWKTYFVFFVCNICFIPIVYFYLPETNGWKLETLDAIFAEAHEKKQNPVFTEMHWRKNGYKNRRESSSAVHGDHRIDSYAETKVGEAREEGTTRHLEEKQHV